MINFLRQFKVNVRIWSLTALFFFTIGITVWQFSTLVTELNEGNVSASEAEAHQTVVYIMILILCAVVVGAAIAIVNSVMGPLRRLQDELRALSEGKYDQPVTDRDHGDGIAAMARAAEFLRENALETQRLRDEAEATREKLVEEEKAAVAAKMAEEERRTAEERAKIEHGMAERQQMQQELAVSFEDDISAVIQSLSSSVADLQLASETVTDAIQQTGMEISAASSATDATSQDMISVAEATEGLSGAIGEIRTQVESANTTTQNALQVAETAEGRVSSLAGASDRIAQVITLINDIAEQTNLLALNATIEAARAGDAGKGFAVVASEVKSLANQTAKATQEIEEQVNAMQHATKETVASVDDIRKAISQVSEISGMIAAAVVEQEASTGEISRSVQNASQGTANLGQNVAQVQQMSQKSAGAADTVNNAAGGLTEQAGVLEDAVNKFLARLRA